MRKYGTTIVLAVIMLVAELHNLFGDVTQNWILQRYVPMGVAWNVKQAGLQLIYILYPLAAILYRRNRINYVTCLSFIWWGVLDTIMYFWNYKANMYAPVYLWVLLFWIVIYSWQEVFNKSKWQKQ